VAPAVVCCPAHVWGVVFGELPDSGASAIQQFSEPERLAGLALLIHDS
jgi:hypothetical protein